MINKKAVRQLVSISRTVFEQCALPNGAIVAARSDFPDCPATVQNYGFVWVRDAAFVCAAADLIHLHDIQEPFFRWVWQRAEGVRSSGILTSMYFPNGVRAGILLPRDLEPELHADHIYAQAIHFVAEIQFDMAGTLLWAISEHRRRTRQLSAISRQLSVRIADALVENWTGRVFRKAHWDLWEERVAKPKRGENLAYSLATCIRGLEDADELLGRKRSRQRTIATMRQALERSWDAKRQTFRRRYGPRTDDPTPDTSLFGLVFPAHQIDAEDPRMAATISRAIVRCRGPLGGLKRYPGDRYSGQIERGHLKLNGGGEWPWVTAWAAIVLAEQGERQAAEREFAWVLRQSRNRPLAEQYHRNGRPGIPALAVSHAFALFAADKLGLL